MDVQKFISCKTYLINNITLFISNIFIYFILYMYTFMNKFIVYYINYR